MQILSANDTNTVDFIFHQALYSFSNFANYISKLIGWDFEIVLTAEEFPPLVQYFWVFVYFLSSVTNCFTWMMENCQLIIWCLVFSDLFSRFYASLETPDGNLKEFIDLQNVIACFIINKVCQMLKKN